MSMPNYDEVLAGALDAIQLLRIAGHDPTADFLLERLIKSANIGGGSNATV